MREAQRERQTEMLIDNKEESERQTNKQRQTGGHTHTQTDRQADS